MNCHECQQMVLTDSGSAARQAHLRECPACQAFVRAHRALLKAGSAVEPPPVLDAAVRRLARERLAARSSGRMSFGWRRLTGRCRLIAAAAVLLLSGWLAVIYRQSPVVSVKPPTAAVIPLRINWGDDALENSLQSLDQTIRDFNRNPSSLPTASGNHEATPAPSLERILQDVELDLYFELNEDVWNIPTSQLQLTTKASRIG